MRIRFAAAACIVTAVLCTCQTNSAGAAALKELAHGVCEDSVLRTMPPRGSDAISAPFIAAMLTGPSHGAATVNPDGSFTYTPAPNYSGADFLAYAATDGSTTFEPVVVRIVVVPVNDAPGFVGGANQESSLAAGAQNISQWATAISAGAANESAQNLTFLVENDNPWLFADQPSVAPNGALTYTPAGDVSGTAHVTVTLRDNGGTTSDGQDTSAPYHFTITITPPPVVQIVNPIHDSVYAAPANFSVAVATPSSVEAMKTVQVFHGTNLLGAFTNAPYLVVMTNLAPGSHSFHAVAVDGTGLSVTSSVVNVSVVIPAAEPPPVIQTVEPPRLTCLAANGGAASIQFTSIKDKLYYVQHTEDLVTWKTIATPLRGTGDPVGWTDVEHGSKRFYRVFMAP